MRNHDELTAGSANEPIIGRTRHGTWALLAVTLCLALGLAFIRADAGLAVSGVSSDGSAACVQYPQRCEDPFRESQNELPFTGAASLLILGLGAVLLASGAVLRLRSRERNNPTDEG